MSIYDDKPWLRSYDAGIPAEIDLPATTYAALLEEGLHARPQRAAVHFLGRTLTFAELENASARFAVFLKACGCTPGHTVGVNLPNTPQYLIALAGAIRAGCAVTGVSPLLSPTEMAYQLNDAGVKVLVTLDAIFEKKLAPVAGDIAGMTHVVATNIADPLPWIKRTLGKWLKKVPCGTVGPLPGKTVTTLPRILADYPADKPAAALSPEDTCLIQYTGGTTGLPKGTELTHANMAAHLTQLTNWLNLGFGEEVFCSGFPFFHQAGLILTLTALRTANTQCLIPDPRNTAHICEQIKTYRPTMLANVPSLYQMLVDNPTFKTLDLSSIRLCLSGAAPFAVEAINALEAYTGKGTVLEVYGMTETSPMITMNPYKGPKKIGSVGLPMPNTRVKLVDVETGTTEVPLGAEGELIVQGPQVMKGYRNKPEETAHAKRDFAGGKWMFTGDVARMDEDGYITICDRVKDMLIVGGFKVFSREVEEKLYQLPEVEFCAIVGLPDDKRPGNDIVKAVVQLSTAARQQDPEAVKAKILDFCRQSVSPYKVPKRIEFIEAIPLTNVGKVDKKALRK